MKVTIKGQVTIPLEVREKIGITPHSEVAFIEDKSGRFYITKVKHHNQKKSRFRSASKVAPLMMSTDEIMALTRGE